jgi:RimJ/RimL family protein N-acetyltransferase
LRKPSICGALAKPPVLIGIKVKLRPKHIQDAANDYSWRQDAELCRLDAAPQIRCSFKEFLGNYAEDLRQLNQSYRFAIETMDGKHIGNCSYFNLDESKREAEMGIMIGNRNYWNQGYGADAITTTLDYFFTRTDMKRVHLKTLIWNNRAQKCFQKCGFVPIGQMVHGEYSFLLMEIHPHPIYRGSRVLSRLPGTNIQKPVSGQ